MIRPFTCLCLLLAAGAGLYTYQAKHESELLDREIARVLKLADAARQRSGVLKAEYALLNDPSRLTDLVQTHLASLRSTAPGQFTTLADLDKRLPAVGAVATPLPTGEPVHEPGPPPDDSVPVATAQPPPVPKTQIAAKPPAVAAAPTLAAAKTANSLTAAVRAANVAMASLSRPTPPAAPVVSAPAPNGASMVAETALPASVGPAPVTALVKPFRPPARPARTMMASSALPPLHMAGTTPAPSLPPRAALVTQVSAPPLVGSALGMARMLTPAMLPP